MQLEFDVFLSYSRQDDEAVTRIAETLRDSGLRVWFDKWELRPGLSWMQGIEEGIKKSQATAVFIGPRGMGDWEKPEMRISLDSQVKSNRPVIPVILPGCPPDIEEQLSAFLKSNTWVDFSRRRLDDEQAIKKLRWGITGQKPTDTPPVAPPPPKRQQAGDGSEVADAAADLASTLRSGNVTFYLGPWALLDGDTSSSACEIARKLLLGLQLIKKDYDDLLPPMDVVGMYYNVRWGDARLENDVIDCIMQRATDVPPIHKQLAELLVVLRDRPPSRVRRRRQQLIVTTNLDVMMERALLLAGVPFTRIVQHRSAQRITINEYRDVRLSADGRTLTLPAEGGEARQIELDDYEALDAFIMDYGQRHVDQAAPDGSGVVKNPLDELPVHEMTEPILYKHLGSQDVENSCAITVDHFFAFARQALWRNCIPAKITEIIGNNPALFLGYSFLDPDYRFTYYTLLRKPFELDMDIRYAVQSPPERFHGDPYRRMEAGLWDYIKKAELKRSKITTVEEDGAAFLKLLLEKVREELA
jgi:hypothetical protein